MTISQAIFTSLVALTAVFPAAGEGRGAPGVARDLGFRFVDGQCLDSAGREGLNPSYFGECGDLRNVVIGRMDFTGTSFRGAQFTNSDLTGSRFVGADLTATNFDAANLSAAALTNATIKNASFIGANLAGSLVKGARIGSSDFTGASFENLDLAQVDFTTNDFTRANFRGARLSGAKLDGVSLRDADLSGAEMVATSANQVVLEGAKLLGANLEGAALEEASLTGAFFNEADLSGANLTGVKGAGAVFIGAAMKNANFTQARLGDASLRSVEGEGANFKEALLEGADLRGAKLGRASFDAASLRGARYGRKTVLPFDATEAASRGMILASNQVLIIWDEPGEHVDRIKAKLEGEDNEVAISAKGETEFEDAAALEAADVVIHINGATFGTDMPSTGQRAIREFVERGGRLIYSGWNAWEYGQGRLQGWGELVLTASVDTSIARLTVKPVSTHVQHPILANIGEFILEGGWDISNVRSFAQTPAIVLATAGDSPAVTVRNVGQGTVVAFSFECGPVRECRTEPMVLQLYANAVNW